MARITMRKVQETKLTEVFSLYLASAAAKGVKDKTLKTYEQHFNAMCKFCERHWFEFILFFYTDHVNEESLSTPSCPTLKPCPGPDSMLS